MRVRAGPLLPFAGFGGVCLRDLLGRQRRRHTSESSFDGTEVAGVGPALDLQHRRLTEDGVVSVARVRVAAHPLWLTATALRLDGLEHVGHLSRVVAGTGEDLRAQEIRLALILPPVLQEVGAQSELRALGNDGAGGAADDRAQDLSRERADLKALALGGLRGAVTEGHVGDSRVP